FDRKSDRVARGLQHDRRYRAEEYGLGEPTIAVVADVTRDLAAAHRVTDQDHVLEVELLDELREIVGEGVHVVAVPRLRGAAVTPAIVCDHAKAIQPEEEQLRVPRLAAEWPAVREPKGLTLDPILV